MARHALAFAEEHERAPLFSRGHRAVLAACESIDRRVGEDERELELGDRAAEHVERDVCAAPHFGKHTAERQPVSWRRVQDAKTPYLESADCGIRTRPAAAPCIPIPLSN